MPEARTDARTHGTPEPTQPTDTPPRRPLIGPGKTSNPPVLTRWHRPISPWSLQYLPFATSSRAAILWSASVSSFYFSALHSCCAIWQNIRTFHRGPSHWVALASIGLIVFGWRLRRAAEAARLARRWRRHSLSNLFAALRLYAILPAAIAFPCSLIAILSAILATAEFDADALLAVPAGLAPVLASTGQEAMSCSSAMRCSMQA